MLKSSNKHGDSTSIIFMNGPYFISWIVDSRPLCKLKHILITYANCMYLYESLMVMYGYNKYYKEKDMHLKKTGPQHPKFGN